MIYSFAKKLLEFIKVGAAKCDKTYFDIFNEMIHPITVIIVTTTLTHLTYDCRNQMLISIGYRLRMQYSDSSSLSTCTKG